MSTYYTTADAHITSLISCDVDGTLVYLDIPVELFRQGAIAFWERDWHTFTSLIVSNIRICLEDRIPHSIGLTSDATTVPELHACLQTMIIRTLLTCIPDVLYHSIITLDTSYINPKYTIYNVTRVAYYAYMQHVIVHLHTILIDMYNGDI
jgi:hypothetical protein